MHTEFTANIRSCALLIFLAGILAGCKKSGTSLENYTATVAIDSNQIYMSRIVGSWTMTGYEHDSVLNGATFPYTWTDTSYSVSETFRIGILDSTTIYVDVTSSSTNFVSEELNKTLVQHDRTAHTLTFGSSGWASGILDNFVYNYLLDTLYIHATKEYLGIYNVYLHSH